MAELQFGSIFTQALQNAMSEKKAERKWQGQMDLQNKAMEQEKTLAMEKMSFDKDKDAKDRANYEAANFFTPTETDPLVAQYGLAQPGVRYNMTDWTNKLDEKKTYDQYLTDIGRNYKFFNTKTDAGTELAKQITNPALLEQAMGKLRGENNFLSPQEKYALKMFRPQGSDKGVYDMEGEQFFLPTAEYNPILDKQFQATENAAQRATSLQSAAISAGPGYASLNYQRERDAKAPVAVTWTDLKGKTHNEYVTRSEFDSGKWLERFPDTQGNWKNGVKGSYRDAIKNNAYISAEGLESVARARGNHQLLSEMNDAREKFNGLKNKIITPPSGGLFGAKQESLKTATEIEDALIRFSDVYGSKFAFADVDRNTANKFKREADEALMKLYKGSTNQGTFTFAPQGTFNQYDWIPNLTTEEQQIANKLLNIKALVEGQPINTNVPNRDVLDYFKLQSGVLGYGN